MINKISSGLTVRTVFLPFFMSFLLVACNGDENKPIPSCIPDSSFVEDIPIVKNEKKRLSKITYNTQLYNEKNETDEDAMACAMFRYTDNTVTWKWNAKSRNIDACEELSYTVNGVDSKIQSTDGELFTQFGKDGKTEAIFYCQECDFGTCFEYDSKGELNAIKEIGSDWFKITRGKREITKVHVSDEDIEFDKGNDFMFTYGTHDNPFPCDIELLFIENSGNYNPISLCDLMMGFFGCGSEKLPESVVFKSYRDEEDKFSGKLNWEFYSDGYPKRLTYKNKVWNFEWEAGTSIIYRNKNVNLSSEFNSQNNYKKTQTYSGEYNNSKEKEPTIDEITNSQQNRQIINALSGMYSLTIDNKIILRLIINGVNDASAHVNILGGPTMYAHYNYVVAVNGKLFLSEDGVRSNDAYRYDQAGNVYFEDVILTKIADGNVY